jgi:hypothetical protein
MTCSRPRWTRRVALLLPVLALGNCVTTGIIDSENPSKNLPSAWGDYWTLPVRMRGSTPGIAPAQLEGFFPQGAGNGRRIVLYLNPARMPADADLCSRGDEFMPGPQPGRYGFVVGALCNGQTTITYATANILASGLTAPEVAAHLEMMRLQLYQALTPGNNHPERLYSGRMYGP